MEHAINLKIELPTSRVGFHYFQDSDHYRQEDLECWVKKIKDVGAAWMVLKGEVKQAIPEEFISGLIKERIEPIIHFALDLSNPTPAEGLDSLLSAYAKWGVKKIVFFENPNQQESWGNQRWSQPNLVGRFIDLFLPLAKMTVNFGMVPFCPPMQAGGQYWDTIFLQQSLEELQKRGEKDVLAELGLSAYGWTWGKSLNWGAGGTERWPQTKPYRIPTGSQDQRSLRTYEWYLSVAQKCLGRTCPVVLLQVGIGNHLHCNAKPDENGSTSANTNLKIIQLLQNENVTEFANVADLIMPIREEVVCGNFWLLGSSQSEMDLKDYAWWSEGGYPSELTKAVLNAIQESSKYISEEEGMLSFGKSMSGNHPLARYLYFPSLEIFHENENQEIIQNYIMRYKPTIGFSLNEAVQASIVDIGADENQIPDGILDALRESGCSVRRLLGTHPKEVNEDYGEELADYPVEKDYHYAKV